MLLCLLAKVSQYMPREIVFKIKRREFKTPIVKVDRRKLYGWTELAAVDDNGNPCTLLTTDETGKYIIPPGGTGIGILSQSGKWVERSELKTITDDGKPAPLFESSFNKVNELKKKVSVEEFLDYDIDDFYELADSSFEMIKAIGNDIYTFDYSYNDSYDPSPAFVMVANDRLFLLVGVKNAFDYLCYSNCDSIDDDDDDRLIDEGDEDIDFSMF